MQGHNQQLSLSKDKIRILLLEGINDSAVELITGSGYSSTTRLMKALDGAELDEAIRNTHIIGIRSRTQLTEEVFAKAEKLIAVGCFSVGTNQVDLDAARIRGIPVFNAPFSNTRSVAELVIGEIVMLFRRIFPRSVSAHDGGWDKSANGSIEVRGKTLGIVGLGHVGSRTATYLKAFGCRVLAYDPYLDEDTCSARGATKTDFHTLLRQSDIVSIHCPLSAETEGMFGAEQFAMMPEGAVLVNTARGSFVRAASHAVLSCVKRLLASSFSSSSVVMGVPPARRAQPVCSELSSLPSHPPAGPIVKP